VLRDALANLAPHVFLGLPELVDDVGFLFRGGAHYVALGLGWCTGLTSVAPDAALPQRRVSHGGYAAEILPALHLDDDGIPDNQWC
jgi:hypothetical protein